MAIPSRWQSMAGVVLLFTGMAVAMVWTLSLSLSLQVQLREQLLDRAELRAQQLSDAMGGQVQLLWRLADQALLDLRARWPSEPGAFAQEADLALVSLPPGLVSHVTVVDAQGLVVFNTLGVAQGVSVADRPHFQRLREGGDEMVMGEPVQARLGGGGWHFVLGRPIYRDGQFDGAVHLVVSTAYLARLLGRLALSDQDLVALVHPDGRFIARSLDNDGAMGQLLPSERPFLTEPRVQSGTFRREGTVDGVARVFGWQRLSEKGAVLVVGLSNEGVLAPLAEARSQALWLTALLSAALAGVGVWIGFLLRHLERGVGLVRESRELLEEAQSMAHVGHWTLNADTGEVRWSDEVYRITGQDPAHFTPSLRRYWDLLPPGEAGRLRPVFDRALVDLQDVDVVHRVVRPDGSERFVRMKCRLKPEDGASMYRGTVQDVTELEEARRALEQLNAGLEQRVRARTQELVALNQELESFTYSVSHDLRTPLRSIHGFAALLREGEADRLSDEGRDFLRRIQEGSSRMGRLINDLLLMARHSRAEVHPQPVDLSAMAQAVAAELARMEPQRQVEWNIEPGLQVRADPVLMEVVLQNLLGNAWKYTSQRPLAHIALRLAPSEAPGQTTFCVSDDGAGFDMTYAAQLFEPFKRLHAHHEFEGTGIGLALVQRVVQRHGGSVRGEGAPGQGARFWVSLPMAPTEPVGGGPDRP